MCFLRCRISPMSFAILRIQKLKTFGDIGGSLSHNYRNRETLNADSERTCLNEHDLDTNEKCMAAIRDRIPEKRRKDAVLCIEHLVTASPDWDGWGTDKEEMFFKQSVKWLQKKYGEANVISTTIHRDETTPHLVAYVVPLDEETGRLNAKKFVGGSRHTLTQMQTDFAQGVKSLGLERGIQGSQAKHISIKDYYEKITNYENDESLEFSPEGYDIPEPTFFESKANYAERVASHVVDFVFNQLRPHWEKVHNLAYQADDLKKQLEISKKTVRELSERAESAESSLKYLKIKAEPYLSGLEACDSLYLESCFIDRVKEVKESMSREIAQEKERQRLIKVKEEMERQKFFEEIERNLAEEKKRNEQAEFDRAFRRMNAEQQANYLAYSQHLRDLHPNPADARYVERLIWDLQQKVFDERSYFSNSVDDRQTYRESKKASPSRDLDNDYGFTL